MSFPYKKYIATLPVFNLDFKPSALILLEWDNFLNFYLEILGHFLHYGIDFVGFIFPFDKYSSSYRLKSAIFDVKWGVNNIVLLPRWSII